MKIYSKHDHISVCNAGWYEAADKSGSCSKCAVGTYKSGAGNSGDLCVPCGPGESTLTHGSTANTDCSKYS